MQQQEGIDKIVRAKKEKGRRAGQRTEDAETLRQAATQAILDPEMLHAQTRATQ